MAGMSTDAVAAQRPKVGEVMIEAGLITREQLEHALEEQRRLQRPLGEVIVTLGLASPGAVANALAEQYGAPLKTEHGFAVGLGLGQGGPGGDDPEIDAVDSALLRRRIEELEALASAWAAEASRLQTELARVAAERDAVAAARTAEAHRHAADLAALADRAQHHARTLTAARVPA